LLILLFVMNTFCPKFWTRAGLSAAATLLLNACAPSQDTPTPTIGVNGSRYLAVGDSYTAGLSAGGLTRASQEYSFTNLLAKQLRGTSPDAAFTQPLLEAGTGAGYLNFVDFTITGFPRARHVVGQAVRCTVINPTACAAPTRYGCWPVAPPPARYPKTWACPACCSAKQK
jgi:hypothetical protein